MKICVLSSGHSIDDSRVFHKEIQTLKRNYSDISFVCPLKESYIEVDGIKVFGVRKRKSRYNRFNTLRDLLKVGLRIKADLYHCHEPDSLFVGWLLKKKLGSKLVYDSHEFHPEAFSENLPSGLRRFVELIIRLVENTLVRTCDYVITVNHMLVDKFRKHNTNVLELPNYPKVEFVPKVDFDGKERELVYIGGLAEENGIRKIIEALNILKKDGTEVKATFIGLFPNTKFQEEMKKYVQDNNLAGNIVFTGHIEHAEALEIMSYKSIGLSLIQPRNVRHVNCQPIKLFEYMAAGCCVIASDFPVIRDVIEKRSCGILVDPDSPQEIARAVEQLLSDPAGLDRLVRNSRRAIEKQYNWKAVEKGLLSIYKELEEKDRGDV